MLVKLCPAFCSCLHCHQFLCAFIDSCLSLLQPPRPAPHALGILISSTHALGFPVQRTPLPSEFQTAVHGIGMGISAISRCLL